MGCIVQFKDKETGKYIKINLSHRTILERKDLFPEEPFKDITVVNYSKCFKKYSELEEVAQFSNWMTRYSV